MAKEQHVSEGPVLTVKDAVKTAMDYFQELFSGPYADLALEEVERSGEKWLVTLGYFLGRKVMGAGISVSPTAVRQYKQIAVDDTTGDVISMKVKRV
jgi:hypothetical protein